MNLTGKYLRIVKPVSDILPSGIVVWCLVDHGDDFIVKTFQPYHGVQEFVLQDKSRVNLEVYWSPM